MTVKKTNKQKTLSFNAGFGAKNIFIYILERAVTLTDFDWLKIMCVKPRDVLKKLFRNTNRPSEQTHWPWRLSFFNHLSYWKSTGSGLVFRCMCVLLLSESC